MVWRDLETVVPRPPRAVPGNRKPSALRRPRGRRARIKDQKHRLTCREEDMPARLALDDRKAKNASIERLCGVQIFGIKRGFQGSADRWGCHDAVIVGR